MELCQGVCATGRTCSTFLAAPHDFVTSKRSTALNPKSPNLTQATPSASLLLSVPTLPVAEDATLGLGYYSNLKILKNCTGNTYFLPINECESPDELSSLPTSAMLRARQLQPLPGHRTRMTASDVLRGPGVEVEL